MSPGHDAGGSPYARILPLWHETTKSVIVPAVMDSLCYVQG
jgi:hypothetical protein